MNYARIGELLAQARQRLPEGYRLVLEVCEFGWKVDAYHEGRHVYDGPENETPGESLEAAAREVSADAELQKG